MNNWINIDDELPEYIGIYECKTNDGIIVDCHINAFGAWTKMPEKMMYGDLYGDKNHPDYTDPGGGMKNIQKRQIICWRDKTV